MANANAAEAKTATKGEGFITDEALAEVKSRVGKQLRHLERSATVTDEWIERYAFSIGDQNPLWTDRKYAERSSYGKLVAPPTMIYVLCGWDIGTGLPGVHALYVRSRLEFDRPFFEGDRLDSTGIMSEITERPSRFAGRSVLQGVETTFKNQNGERVCVARHWNLRTERGAARDRGTHTSTKTHRYSKEEIRRIEGETFREVVRGDLKRAWKDVEVGEELPTVVRGPLTVTDMVGYMRGGFGGISHGFFMYTHGLGTSFRRRHPDAVIFNSLGIPDSPEAVHWDDGLAQRSGLAAAYDIGPQRIGWMGQTVTNWMGDQGMLRVIDINLKKIVLMADTTWCRGKVVSKERVNGTGQVGIALVAVNQREEIVAQGEAVVELPD